MKPIEGDWRANQEKFASSWKCQPPTVKTCPTSGSPTSKNFEQPYCGSLGTDHRGTTSLTNGSFSHSATSWLIAAVLADIAPNTPGSIQDAQAKVCVPLDDVVALWKPPVPQVFTLVKLEHPTAS